MQYVYLARSEAFPTHTYVGITSHLKKRLAAHNAGQGLHTAKFKPWKLVTSIGFVSDTKARAFERYLKSPSGRAFAHKRLW